MYKPIKRDVYIRWINQYGWSLVKGKIDWLLLDEKDNFICTIKIQHPGPKEVVADSVRKTERKLKERGLI